MGHFFIKAGHREHIETLRQKGLLYCNTLEYFSKCEDSNGVGDKYEKALDIWHPLKGEFYFKKANDVEDTFKKFPGELIEVIRSNSQNPGNLFCLYTYNTPDVPELGKSFKIPPPLIGEGDCCLFILHPTIFLNRVQIALNNLSLKYRMDFIKYQSLNGYRIQKDYFMKDNKYSYQNEYRIFIENESNEPLQFEIGDISDITMLIPNERLLLADFKFDTGPNDNVWLQGHKSLAQ